MRKTILYQFLLLIMFSLIIFTLTGCTFGGSYETAEHEINEEFANISIKTDTADIVLLPSGDGICRVTCYEEEKQKHTVEVQDGTLVIDTVNKKQWYDYI